MERVKFVNETCAYFVDSIRKQHNLNIATIASQINISAKSLSDWKCGKSLMPLEVYTKLLAQYKVPRLDIEIVDDLDQKRKAGALGGLKRLEIYGNPGTAEGRRKGGLIAQVEHSNNEQSLFILRKRIVVPEKSSQLAEFIGVLLGDGHMNKRQITISLSSLTDRSYSAYVANLASHLFKIDAFVQHPYKNCLKIVLSSTAMVEAMETIGLVRGNKVKNQVDVPSWIKDSPKYAQSAVRGLFDTDGCVYVDKHVYKNARYRSIAINFTNRSIPLLNFWKEQLECLGLHPTKKTPYSVFLRREKEVALYFQLIGSSNHKHKDKYASYILNKYGEVPKWS